MITGIDHLVLTVRCPKKAAAFYEKALGLEIIEFGSGRLALRVGAQKINLHTLGQETRNHACIGAGDICLLTDVSLDQVINQLSQAKISVIEGPVERSGAKGNLQSIYFNDPDGNLIEVSHYEQKM